MNISEHFDIKELVPAVIWNQYGSKASWFIDPNMPQGLEFIRSIFNKPITINNWHTGGTFQNRGYRLPDSKVGAKYSQHKFGRAIDFNVQGLTSDEVWDIIKDNWYEISRVTYFTTIEAKEFTKGWTHLDMRLTGSGDLLIVKP